LEEVVSLKELNAVAQLLDPGSSVAEWELRDGEEDWLGREWGGEEDWEEGKK
jgi:hypothetical protein